MGRGNRPCSQRTGRESVVCNRPMVCEWRQSNSDPRSGMERRCTQTRVFFRCCTLTAAHRATIVRRGVPVIHCRLSMNSRKLECLRTLCTLERQECSPSMVSGWTDGSRDVSEPPDMIGHWFVWEYPVASWGVSASERFRKITLSPGLIPVTMGGGGGVLHAHRFYTFYFILLCHTN